MEWKFYGPKIKLTRSQMGSVTSFFVNNSVQNVRIDWPQKKLNCSLFNYPNVSNYDYGRRYRADSFNDR